jgi:hypothetical protein
VWRIPPKTINGLPRGPPFESTKNNHEISNKHGYYHLVMTNIAMENPVHKWRFIAGKIIYFYGPFSMAMLNNQRVNQ